MEVMWAAAAVAGRAQQPACTHTEHFSISIHHGLPLGATIGYIHIRGGGKEVHVEVGPKMGMQAAIANCIKHGGH